MYNVTMIDDDTPSITTVTLLTKEMCVVVEMSKFLLETTQQVSEDLSFQLFKRVFMTSLGHFRRIKEILSSDTDVYEEYMKFFHKHYDDKGGWVSSLNKQHQREYRFHVSWMFGEHIFTDLTSKEIMEQVEKRFYKRLFTELQIRNMFSAYKYVRSQMGTFKKDSLYDYYVHNYL